MEAGPYLFVVAAQRKIFQNQASKSWWANCIWNLDSIKQWGDVIKFKMVFLVPQNAAYSFYVYREPDCSGLYPFFWKGHFPGS